jgi:hypothetical protein
MSSPTIDTNVMKCVLAIEGLCVNDLSDAQTFEVRLEEPRPEERTKPYDRRDYNFRDAPSDYGDGDVYMGALGGYVNLGIVPTTGPERQATGRIVAFPNWIQVCDVYMPGMHD